MGRYGAGDFDGEAEQKKAKGERVYSSTPSDDAATFVRAVNRTNIPVSDLVKEFQAKCPWVNQMKAGTYSDLTQELKDAPASERIIEAAHALEFNTIAKLKEKELVASKASDLPPH